MRLLSLALVLACALAALPALAQQPGASPPEPPQEPILRIDPGMHTAQINRIGVNDACTLLVTGAHDKTVRLWRLPEGRLLRTLRPPIGPGNDGKVYAATLAPDGSWVAAGGWDVAARARGGSFVYIFDASTGALAARLGPVRNSVVHLVVSSDGRYLAATLPGGDGLRVWEKTGPGLTSWRLVVDDRDYGGQDAYGAAFDRAGALYTVGLDGKVRRYAAGSQGKPVSVVTRGGRQPSAVAVHPSGNSIAIGYADTTSVEVYDANTLAWRFAADTTSANNGDLGSVAWSADGERLYAGGWFKSGDDRPIFVWDQAGKGPPRMLRGTVNTIMQLLPCGAGIAVGAADPAFGVIGADGRRVTWRKGVQADVRGARDQHFTVAAMARSVRFGLDQDGKQPVLFDLAAEQLKDAPERPGDLDEADVASLPVTDWVNDPNPKLGGVPITLEKLEKSRSLAIAPNRKRFVLGAEWSLRGYDSAGKLRWQTDVPGAAWGVNIPRGGRVVLAAYGDGTIRWHRLKTGEELLALFVHKEDRRWVAWTPKGYYMASPGAESLIGWHVNKGWNEAAQFYPVDRFRAQFNRPDIVKRVLKTLIEAKAIQEANARAKVDRGEEDVRKLLPPIVVIQGPGDGSGFRTPEVTIDYHFHPAARKAITRLEYLIDGAAYRAPLFPEGGEADRITAHKLALTLPRKDVTVSLVAYEGDKASEPATIKLRWDGPKAGQADLKRLRALFIGVDKYTKVRALRFANKDASDLAALFKAHAGKSYRAVEARVLTDARRDEVIEALEWLEKGSQEGDVNLLFLAGHGHTDERQQFYFMTADSDPNRLRATAISKDDIVRTIRSLNGTRVVMLDTCRAGAVTDAGDLATPSRVDMNKAANEIGDKSSGVLLYASAQGRQQSLEYPEWGNGAFTKAMIEGLSGEADGGKLGYVESDELALYVRRRVIAMAREKGFLQEPVRVKPDAAPEMKIVRFK